MKAEWIHTDDGLTIEVTATSDVDLTNFNSFFLDKPHRPRLRVTKTIRDAAKNYAGLHLSYIQYADNKNLTKDGYQIYVSSDEQNYFWCKNIGKTFIYLLYAGVRRLKTIEMAQVNLDEVITVVKNDINITQYEGIDVKDLGNVRTMGQVKQRLRKNI